MPAGPPSVGYCVHASREGMMTNGMMRRTALALIVALLAACNEDTTSPEPESGASPAGAELSALTGSWTTKANYPESAQGAAAVATVKNAQGQSMLYVIGGQAAGGSVSRVRAYNAATNTWFRKAEYPIPVYSTNGAGVINGKIFVSGGSTDFHWTRNQLYMYDPATNVWSRKRDMPDYTWGGITGVINNQLYVLTCTMQEDCYTLYAPLHLYRYNPATDQWTDLGLSPEQSRAPMGGTIGGKLYFTGQSDLGSALLTVYDPASNQWSRKTPMNHSRYDGAWATLRAKLYIFGGWEWDPTDGSNTRLRTVNVYDPASDSWTKATPMPEARSGQSAGLVFLNGQPRIEVVGGPKPDNLQFTP
jgi:N-acetylneuraminic acid mutarotase